MKSTSSSASILAAAMAVSTLANINNGAMGVVLEGKLDINVDPFNSGTSDGNLAVTVNAAGTTVQGTLTGVGVCSDADDGPDGCPVHIHSGYSCESAATQQGHYWVGGGADPWNEAQHFHLNSEADTILLGPTTTNTALTNAYELAGRVAVSHEDAPGGPRIGCGELVLEGNQETLLTAKIQPYSGTVEGTLYGFFAAYDFNQNVEVTRTTDTNVQVTLVDGPGGTRLLDNAAVNTLTISMFEKNSDCSGDPFFTFPVFDSSDFAQKLFINNAQVPLVLPDSFKDMSIGYTVNSEPIICDALVQKDSVYGQITFYRTPYGLGYVGHATGLSTTDNTITDGAGWHVHEGTDCSATGAHATYEGVDPWTHKYKTIAGYETNADSTKGRTLFMGEFDGYTLADISDLTFVMHATNGKVKVACADFLAFTGTEDAISERTESPTSDSPTVSPTDSPTGDEDNSGGQGAFAGNIHLVSMVGLTVASVVFQLIL